MCIEKTLTSCQEGKKYNGKQVHQTSIIYEVTDVPSTAYFLSWRVGYMDVDVIFISFYMLKYFI